MLCQIANPMQATRNDAANVPGIAHARPRAAGRALTLVVLEVVGAITDFYRAVRRSGLQWLIDADGDVSSPDEDFRLVGDASAEVPNRLSAIFILD
jgi:hypothetical protein